MRGVIDRLVDMGDGVYEVHDYKTAMHMPIMDHLRRDRQLALYSIPIYEHYHDVKKVVLVWHFLQFNARDVVVEKTKKELEQVKSETIALIKKIELEKDFKPNRSALCDWCEFKSSCPEWKHVYETEALPKNRFLKDPGVKLVDQYAELMDKKRDLEEKIGEIKEAMIEFAKKDKVSAVFGSNFKARIAQFSIFKVEEKEGLEDFLVKEGKWREVSFINSFRLSSIIKNKLWDPGFIEKIKKFGKMERGQRISLSRLKEK
ncbi:RecB family exonuclease [Candidatus Aenigmatarchaeota archaeon]